MIDKFRKGDNDNILFMTSCCNNHCIMCCQPPQKEDESLMFFERNLRLIESADMDTDYVCITGGEPTLHEQVLFQTIHAVQNRLQQASIHILSNGRKFSDIHFIAQFERQVRGRIVLGIPLHADNHIDHDLIAGAKGAFYETLKGVQNLGMLGYQVELRIVLLKQNVSRLPQIAEFITLNLPFVSQVSIMGLEVIGFADNNYNKVWVDPKDCHKELEQAIAILEQAHIRSRLFNMPLCLLPYKLWDYAAQSISNWKKSNLNQCKKCIVRHQCCGVFATSSKQSDNIRAIKIRL